jgi:hypothetical protein
MAIASFKNRYSVVGLAELFLREYTCCFSLYVLYVRYTHRLVLLHVSVLALQKQKSVALTFRFLWETNHHLGPCGGWWGVSPHVLLDETTGEEAANRECLQYLKCFLSCFGKAICYHALAVLGEVSTSFLLFKLCNAKDICGCQSCLFESEVKIRGSWLLPWEFGSMPARNSKGHPLGLVWKLVDPSRLSPVHSTVNSCPLFVLWNTTFLIHDFTLRNRTFYQLDLL